MGYVKMTLPNLQREINMLKRYVGVPLIEVVKSKNMNVLSTFYGACFEYCDKEHPDAIYIKEDGWSEGLEAIWACSCIYAYLKKDYQNIDNYISVGEALRICRSSGLTKTTNNKDEAVTKSNACARRVERLLAIRNNNGGALTRELGNLIKVNKTPFLQVDINQLLKDIYYYSNGFKPARNRWAMSVYVKKNENSEVENND